MNLTANRWALALGLSTLLLTACSDSNDTAPAPPEPPPPVEPDFLPIAQPEVSDPPAEGDLFLLSTTFDLADVGYEQREFFLSGEATGFSNLNELGSD
ncbi:MAG: alpha/beta hydrolase domain-containing protein, partial [Haliea sp.]|nr:alpha/beta hydrolase domain-containing protein [Haliea sp.]